MGAHARNLSKCDRSVGRRLFEHRNKYQASRLEYIMIIILLVDPNLRSIDDTSKPANLLLHTYIHTVSTDLGKLARDY